MLAEVTLAARSLARSPLFTGTAILTLALGIGANTAIFSFASALLLRPLPFPDPDRLIRISSVRGAEPGKLTPREWEELDEDSTLFEGVAAWYPSQYNSSAGGPPEVVNACMTTANLFRVLGVLPQLGSSWKEGTHRERNPVTVISHGLWQRRFGASRAIVGQTIQLDSSGYTVTGIAAPGFDFPGRMDVFRAAYLGGAQNWDVRSLFAVARLRPGVTAGQVAARLVEFGAHMEQTFPATNQGIRFELQPLREAYTGDVRAHIVLTLGLTAVVLLIACANVVNLLLSRGFTRRREIALKSALGAPRARIMREILLEAVILSLAGGVAGLGFASWWAGMIRDWLRIDLPAWMTVEIDGQVLLFASAVSVASGLVAGILPALTFSSAGIDRAIRECGRGSSESRSSVRVRSALVTTGAALAVALLALSGLLVKSFHALQQVDAGFDRSPALTFRTDPPWARYREARQTAPFYRRASEALAQIPGVTAVAANHSMPLAVNQNYGKPSIEVEGEANGSAHRNPFVNVQIVSPNYHEVMGIPVREGRSFTVMDTLDTVPVAIISRPLARRLFGGAGALGRRVRMPGQLSAFDEANGGWFQIVGVAEGVRSESLTAPPGLDIYLSNQQQFAGDTYFILRTASNPAPLAPAVSRALQSVDPDQPAFDIRTLQQRVGDTIWQRRIAGTLSLGFGGLGLFLSAIGSYGLLSSLVSQRTREIGIRQALGSSRLEVWWMVMRQGLLLSGTGIGAGLGAAAIGGRLLSTMLYEVSGQDTAVLAEAAAATALAAFVSAALPAWRAARISPVDALRPLK